MKTRKHRFLIATLTASAALLASCASTDDRSTLAPGYDARMINDAEYIAIVETLAARRGVRVQWVNPPKVRVSDD